jgi:hypothetical protein
MNERNIQDFEYTFMVVNSAKLINEYRFNYVI